MDAVMHRPLREGQPWNFGMQGVTPAAYEDSKSQCVPHQLIQHLKDELGMADDIGDELDQRYEHLDDGNPESPYLEVQEDGTEEKAKWHDVGVTAAMVVELANVYGMQVHVMLGGVTRL